MVNFFKKDSDLFSLTKLQLRILNFSSLLFFCLNLREKYLLKLQTRKVLFELILLYTFLTFRYTMIKILIMIKIETCIQKWNLTFSGVGGRLKICRLRFFNKSTSSPPPPTLTTFIGSRSIEKLLTKFRRKLVIVAIQAIMKFCEEKNRNKLKDRSMYKE